MDADRVANFRERMWCYLRFCFIFWILLCIVIFCSWSFNRWFNPPAPCVGEVVLSWGILGFVCLSTMIGTGLLIQIIMWLLLDPALAAIQEPLESKKRKPNPFSQHMIKLTDLILDSSATDADITKHKCGAISLNLRECIEQTRHRMDLLISKIRNKDIGDDHCTGTDRVRFNMSKAETLELLGEIELRLQDVKDDLIQLDGNMSVLDGPPKAPENRQR